MSSPIVYLEEQLALRESLAQSAEMMENHLASRANRPGFVRLQNGLDITEQSLADVKLQIADVDARIERLRSGNA